MENLNAEQVKKWLEICAEDTPYPDQSQALLDALALINSQEQRIKELTEENERLRAQNETLEIYNADYKFRNKELTAFNRRWAKECADLQDECEQIKAKTVRKMQERLKEVSHMTYNINSVEIEGVVYVSEIDQIAKEMLEGENEN